VTTEPVFSIVIPSHNGGELILQCIHTLMESLSEADQIIVVDNGSRDGSVLHFRRIFGDRIELITFSRAKGFARACNSGASHARGKYLIFLNQDLFINETTIPAVLRAIRKHPNSIIGARIYEPEGRTLQHMGGMVLANGLTEHVARGELDTALPSTPAIRCDYITGAFLLVSRHLFNDLGGFDVRFSPAYFEETDFCFRAAARDFTSIVVPDITARHFEAQTSGTESLKYAFRYHVNRLRFVAKHFTWRALASTFFPAEREWWQTPLPLNARRGARLAYMLMMLELPRWMWQRMRVKPRYSPQEVTR